MKSKSSPAIVFRKAVDGDIAAAAALMRAAFKMWKAVGFKSSGLTEKMVRSFLVKDGYVAETEDQKIVASVCINIVKPQVSRDQMRVLRAHRTDTTVLAEPSLAEYFATSTFAYFYSLAVDPGFGKIGIGQKCLEFIESEAVKHRCSGILLETGKRTGWLVEWYERSGFRVIGNFTRQGEPVIFMLKKLK
jgi:ribosomal protein S18 acetylase RimI-like enzyme